MYNYHDVPLVFMTIRDLDVTSRKVWLFPDRGETTRWLAMQVEHAREELYVFLDRVQPVHLFVLMRVRPVLFLQPKHLPYNWQSRADGRLTLQQGCSMNPLRPSNMYDVGTNINTQT